MPEPEMIGNDSLPVRDSGAWAKEKLYYLDHYLGIFSVGMHKRWKGKLYYVDLFAGPGRCRIRETHEEIDGSPLIALKFNFAKYFFFESDPSCFKALESRIGNRAPEKLKNIELVPGDCNKDISKVSPLQPSSLGVAFIDPTGISSIPFETIRKLTERRKIDLIINFPEGMGIRMNLHQYTAPDENALTFFMGSDRWKQQFKRQTKSFNETCHAIAKEYLENLRKLGYLAFDSDRIPIRTDQDALLYYLLFASKDPKGTEFWHKITLINPHGQRKLPGF
jgi:three-Cys-motif partner protein